MNKSILRNILYCITVLFFLSFINSCDKESSTNENPALTILYPNGGELLEKGKTYEIEWITDLGDEVRIELYSSNSMVATIVNSTINNGQFDWEVSESIEAGIKYRIQISSTKDISNTDLCDGRFIIVNPIERSVLVDPRDGQEYKTVKIGDQWWMAENFNYSAPSGSNSYFFDSAYSNTYGKLYTWQSAYNNAPPGWHLPTADEWKEMEAYLGMLNEKLDNEGWRGEFTGDLIKAGNASEFGVIWSGYCNASVGKFGHMGYEARFWTATIASDEQKYWARLLQINKSAITRNNTNHLFGLSVRYVKDD